MSFSNTSKVPWNTKRLGYPEPGAPGIEFLTAAVLATSVAAALVFAPVLLIVPALGALALLAFHFPAATTTACIAATALYQGVYLQSRVSVGAFPVAAFDLLPILVLVAALGFRAKGRSEARAASLLVMASVLLAAGLVVGVVHGWINGASAYQLMRVVRVETGLMTVLVATLIAGRVPTWRDAVYRGVFAAGVLVAIQTIVSFGWASVEGQSFWAALGFPSNVDVITGEILRGNVNVLRTPELPSYLMLPALCLGLLGKTRRATVLVPLILLASLLTLSRGFWLACAICILTVSGLTLLTHGRSSLRIFRIAALSAMAIVIGLGFAGDAIETRLEQTLSLRTSFREDLSATTRLAETQTALAAVTASPISFFSGVGAGIIVPHSGLRYFAGTRSNVTPLLENSLLGRWTNMSLLSLAGTLLLLLGAVTGAARRALDLRDPSSLARLAAMGLCLPAVVIGSLTSQVLLSPIATMPFWILAATLLAGDLRRGPRAALPTP